MNKTGWLKKREDLARRQEQELAVNVLRLIRDGATIDAQNAVLEFHRAVSETRFKRFLADLGEMGCEISKVIA